MVRPGTRSLKSATACLLLLAVFLVTACANSNQTAGEPLLEARFVPERATDRLAPDAPSEYAYFASSLDVDDDTVVVGAWGESDAGRNTGAVYVFERLDTGWEQRARLTASDASAGARFGHAVAIEGDVLLVGAVYHDEFGHRAGAVYVFGRDGEAWREQTVLHPSDAGPDALFGSSVALSEGTAAIGASGPAARSVYVFGRSGDTWMERAKLVPGAVVEGARFGSSVAIHGGTIVVGAWIDRPEEEVETPASESSAFVFERVDAAWSERAQLTSGGPGTFQRFGVSVAVDGGSIIVGAPGERESAYLFRRTDRGWELEAELVSASASDEHFGTAVSIQRDLIVVGAPGHDGHTGTAYVYRLEADDWRGTTQVIAPDAHLGLQLAGTVAMDRGTIVFGATGDQTAGAATGAAFVYR